MTYRTTTLGLTLLPLLTTLLTAQQSPIPAGEAPPPPGPGAQPPKVEVGVLKTGAPNDWFDKTRFNLGAHLNKDEVAGVFNWKNPRNERIQWKDFQGSCQCVKVVIKTGQWTYELVKKPRPNTLIRLDPLKGGGFKRVKVDHINIEPGDSGTLKVFMEMNGMQGFKAATLDISTTDKINRLIRLEWQAQGIKLFDANPPEVFFNDMGWADKRKFSFKVSSSVYPDFKLLEHEPLPEYVKLTNKKQVEVDGKKLWLVEGTIGPNADPNAGGARLVFKTDQGKKKVELGIVATIKRPLEISPGTFFSFGPVSRRVGKECELRIVPNDGFNLKLEKVEFLTATVDKKFLTCESSLDGKVLVLKVKLKPGAKGRYILKGSMAVSLNHPSMRRQVFDFNGILR